MEIPMRFFIRNVSCVTRMAITFPPYGNKSPLFNE